MPEKVQRLINSFRAAWRGLVYIYKNERNFRLQIIIGIITAVLSFYFPLRSWEQVVIFLLIIAVLIMEMLNTVVENLMDLLKPRLHQYVEVIKDIMASAVLLTSLGALIIGAIIFFPHLVVLIK